VPARSAASLVVVNFEGRLTRHTDSVYGVAFSGDGPLAPSASWDQTSKMRDVQSGRERTLAQPQGC